MSATSLCDIFAYNFTWILRAWTGPNTHKNSSKATTIAASPVYEVIPPLLKSLRDLLGASILSSFICSGWPQGESFLLPAFFLPARPEASGRVTAGFSLPDTPQDPSLFFSSDKFQPPWPEVRPEVWPFSLFMEGMCSPSYQLKDKV